jgi:hypothetical protein
VHLGVIWIISSRSVFVFSMIDDREAIYPCVSIAFQCALTFAIEKKITLVGDVCFKPPITIKFHNLHVGDIRGAVGEITSYHEMD